MNKKKRSLGKDVQVPLQHTKKSQSSMRRKCLYIIRGLLLITLVSALLVVMFMPVLRITGTSMSPTFVKGNYVICIKTKHLQQGDIIAFYDRNKILVKRVVATSGQYVNLDEEGHLYIDYELYEEPYLEAYAFGQTNIKMPYQVPENSYFVMGDNRKVSIDSRDSAIGTVKEARIIGKVWRLWPFSKAKRRPS